MTAKRKGFFSRLFGLFKPRKRPQEDWLEAYNQQAAPIGDDLMDLNQTRR